MIGDHPNGGRDFREPAERHLQLLPSNAVLLVVEFPSQSGMLIIITCREADQAMADPIPDIERLLKLCTEGGGKQRAKWRRVLPSCYGSLPSV